MLFYLCLLSEWYLELADKRERAMDTHEKLSLQAQIVLDVIEREEVAQALRQDKVQNLNYLKEHFGVCT